MKRSTILPMGKNSKKIWLSGFVCVLVVLSSSVTFAMDPLGPPITNLEPGQFQLGFEYSRSSIDFQLVNGKGAESINGSPSNSGKAIPVELNDFEQNSSYVNFGYGVDYNWEVFVRLSSTKAKFGDSISKQSEEFESDNTPAFGGGIKATFFEKDYLKIGGIVQANWNKFCGKLNAPLWYSPHFIETDSTEIQITLGASYMWIDGIWIYGGPLFHFISGEFHETYVEEAETGEFLLSEYSWDIEQDSMYGGYIGTQVEIGKNCFLNIEYQFTGAADAFGAGLVLGF